MTPFDIPIDPALLEEEQAIDADLEDAEGELVDDGMNEEYTWPPVAPQATSQQFDVIHVSRVVPPPDHMSLCSYHRLKPLIQIITGHLPMDLLSRSMETLLPLCDLLVRHQGRFRTMSYRITITSNLTPLYPRRPSLPSQKKVDHPSRAHTTISQQTAANTPRRKTEYPLLPNRNPDPALRVSPRPKAGRGRGILCVHSANLGINRMFKVRRKLWFRVIGAGEVGIRIV